MADIHEFPLKRTHTVETEEPEKTQVFLTTDAISIQPKNPGIAEIIFGPVSVNLTYDAIHDLTYRLAAFMAICEGDQEYCERLLSPTFPSPQSISKNTSNSSTDDE